MNRWNGIGRITAKPELRYTNSNVGVCNFTIAVTRKFKDNNGVYQSDFINCVAFKKTAELICEYINKGDLLGIEGRIQTRSYEGQDGKKVYVTEVVVEQIHFLQTKKSEKSNNNQMNNVNNNKQNQTEDPFSNFGKQLDNDCDLVDFNQEQLPF